MSDSGGRASESPQHHQVRGDAWPPEVSSALRWVQDGQRLVEQTVAALDDDVRLPSALPRWSRGHVITHLARNADALVNLLEWARTGNPTPMYSSRHQRDAEIEAGAERPLGEQAGDLAESGRRFAEAAARLTEHGWSARVTSAQGRDIPASEVPWMRARELWLHVLDLDAGVAMDDLPDDIAEALVRDVASWMSSRIDTAIELRPHGHPPVRFGPAAETPSAVLSGPACRIAGWLTGRTSADELHRDGVVPTLPRWL
ncbi:maleylpyruvate isomerase family mycothiol-dependent enzyme [Haloechinothrix sp. YIM 98757]|uniref:Maleylpyruvate isomerase family mycothiol-dependent enzyme n=1 Tax=Haloechinothrix aidingensis TaxID=2752311 RepID=A0A837ZUI3_9PSEU|nr:maleylpyruvate isomerase family mycothiol-dependent enzyme [Haloechinothrix aidingensis]